VKNKRKKGEKLLKGNGGEGMWTPSQDPKKKKMLLAGGQLEGNPFVQEKRERGGGPTIFKFSFPALTLEKKKREKKGASTQKKKKKGEMVSMVCFWHWFFSCPGGKEGKKAACPWPRFVVRPKERAGEREKKRKATEEREGIGSAQISIPREGGGSPLDGKRGGGRGSINRSFLVQGRALGKRKRRSLRGEGGRLPALLSFCPLTGGGGEKKKKGG